MHYDNGPDCFRMPDTPYDEAQFTAGYTFGREYPDAKVRTDSEDFNNGCYCAQQDMKEYGCTSLRDALADYREYNRGRCYHV